MTIRSKIQSVFSNILIKGTAPAARHKYARAMRKGLGPMYVLVFALTGLYVHSTAKFEEMMNITYSACWKVLMRTITKYTFLE
jgi:hypothetical protein